MGKVSGRSADYVGWLDSLWMERIGTTRRRRPDLSIGILLWPSFPLMSLSGVIEPLRHAADFADQSRPLYCRWSIMGSDAIASCGIRVKADAPYTNPNDFDYIAVIGGLLAELRKAPPRHRDYVRVAAAAGVPVIGVCTGAFVLAQEGLLTYSKAAIHPFHAQDFKLAFPRLALSTRDDFISRNGRITVPGGISVLSLMSELVRSHCGPERAAKIVHQLSLTQRKGVSAFDRGRATEHNVAADARIQRAVVLIEGSKGRDLTPESVARAVGLSSRQFTRLFRQNLGRTPKQFIIEIRLRFARFLVENGTLPVTEIAYEAGFADCAHLSSAFKARFGVSPRALRAGEGIRADRRRSR